MIAIIVNDKPQQVPKDTSIAALLRANDVPHPDMVSVQLNNEFVHRDSYSSTTLHDGDLVDFLYFMGGGAEPHS